MNFVRTFGTTELILILLFVGFYTFYIIRIVRIGQKLQTGYLKILIKLFIRSSYFALIIIAFLGPSYGESEREIKSVGKDIFICVDLSQSMNAFDVQPTRLEKVKFELKNIVEAFNSDRIGLIMFSNEAFMQCPLTYDNNALSLFIQALNTDLVPNTGTDFGPPLKMALEKLNNEDSRTRQKAKTIILISDGEDFGDDTNEIANDIENSGIKLFTLGVGTESGSRITMRRGFKRDDSGNEVISKLNSTSLEKIARDTGGKYFEINKSRNDVKRLISAINDIEGELRDVRQVDTTSNKYYYFLILALIFICVDLTLSVKVLAI